MRGLARRWHRFRRPRFREYWWDGRRWRRIQRTEPRSRPVRQGFLAVERAAARWILRFHALRRCVDCDQDGCAVWDWAVEAHRRERVVAVLLGGRLPAGATVEDLREALDRIRRSGRSG